MPTNYDLKHRQGTQIHFKTQRYKSTITKKSAAKKCDSIYFLVIWNAL